MTKLNIEFDENLPIVGILGDGQLAMMMAQAYQCLGGKVFVFGSSDVGPASGTADRVFIGDPNTFEDIQEFFNAVDVVTLENEFNDSSLLNFASSRCSTPVYPNPSRFGLIEDKLSEKQFFRDLGINLAEFFEVKSEDDLIDASGYLKIVKGGYDGIGTTHVHNKQEAVSVYRAMASAGSILFERDVMFTKELSLIAVSDSKDLVFYPIVETHQEQGTCRFVNYPAGVSEIIEQDARSQVRRILERLGTRGLFAFEFFLCSDDQLILNESAPRPHNSGHITLDLTNCSQFENHMRAVADLALIEPELLAESMTMVNLLGSKNGEFQSVKINDQINDPNLSVTLYGKKQLRIRRKMGHINIWGPNQLQRAQNLLEILDI